MEKSGSGMVVSRGHAGARHSRGARRADRGRPARPPRSQAHHDRERSDPRGRSPLGFILTIHQPRPWLLYLLSALLMFASPFFTSGPRRHSADHRDRRRIARREFADPDHAMGHADGRHAAGRIQRRGFGYRMAFMLNSLSFVFSAWAIWQISRARRLPRRHARTAPRARAPWHEYREGLALHGSACR